VLRDDRLDLLARYAATHRHDNAVAARGRCLHATLTLGREAARLGLAERVAVVRWRVRDDADFLEHWALSLENGRVLDMTAVQVDGHPRPLREIDGYPANYVQARRYPLGLVLGGLPPADPPDGRYPLRALWRLHRRLYRFDARRAIRARSARSLFEAAVQLGRVALTLTAGSLLERAIRRLGSVLTRLG
jgi:hypothetical protein